MLSTELLVKGVFLGLALHAARILGLADHACWRELGLTLACAAVGLTLGSLAALSRKRGGAAASRLVLGLLEDGWLAQAGLMAGLSIGIVAFLHPLGGEDAAGWLIGMVGAGAMLGFLFAIFQVLTSSAGRLAMGAVLGLMIVGGMGIVFGLWGPEGLTRVRPAGCVVAGIWLLAMALFYAALVFTSFEPESETEISCLTLVLTGLGVFLASGTAGWGFGLGLLMPSLAFLLLGEGIATRLRLGKLLTRAKLNMAIGNWRKALGCSSRALGIDPGNPRALADFWRLTSKLDTDELLADSNARSLVRAERCLDWVGRRLGSNPGPAGLGECERMLTLVEKLDPPLTPLADYWRVVADLHAGEMGRAAQRAQAILVTSGQPEGESSPLKQARQQSWLLTHAWHDRLRAEVASPLIQANPRALLEAWEAIEEALEGDPENPRLRASWRSLVESLSESIHGPLVGQGSLKVDWRRVEGLGVAMLEDSNKRLRGAELVRLAARANPGTSPASLIAVAKSLQAGGDEASGLEHFRMAVALGQIQGPATLAAADRELFYRAVKYLAEMAEHVENLPEATKFWTLYSEYDRSGLETLRKLADLNERLGDPSQALRAVEKGLLYSAKDADLLARRERYLWSISPEQVEASPETFKGIIDAGFCVERARKALDSTQADPEWLSFADHLLRLALLVRPDHLPSRHLLGRALAKMGDREGAVAQWEEQVRANKPTNWVEGESDDAWQRTNQSLGDAYLELGRYQDCIDCLEDFRKSSRSGATTLFKLGQAHEGLGQYRQARRHFREVEGFEGNPLVWQARDALERIRQAEAGPPG